MNGQQMKNLPAMIIAALLATSQPAAGQARPDPFARARNDIVRFCQRDTACATTQRESLGHFVTMMAGFNDPGSATARRCTREGRTTRGSATFVDWTVARRCLQRAARGVPVGGTLRQN